MLRHTEKKTINQSIKRVQKMKQTGLERHPLLLQSWKSDNEIGSNRE